jgi:TolB protein
MKKKIILFLTWVFLGWCNSEKLHAQSQTGIFDSQADVGKLLHPGSASYDAKSGQYILEGAGYNIWGTHDEFHFIWKRLQGNFILKGNFAFITQGGIDDKKIGWMVRTSLDTSSAHVIGVVHGAGLTSLQYRRTPGAITEEKKFSLKAADFIQLERRGNLYIVSVSKGGGPSMTQQIDSIYLGNRVYAGLFICSHDKNVSEKAMVSRISITQTK